MIRRPTRGSVRAAPAGRQAEAGQILPLVALFIVVLFGMAALAIDVSRAYADLRFYRAAADAASLAGAQDLQVPNSRMVSFDNYTKARSDALRSLEAQLGGSGSACGPSSANIVNCSLAGTPYVISIKANPSPSCSATCDPYRAVQVTVTHPNYGLTFARVLGSNEWDVGTTSVAGLGFGKSYTIITLRPPKKSGSTFIINDIAIDGGSVVTVKNGDVGTNSNMEYSGTGSMMVLDPGYNMYYYPGTPPAGPQWGSSPVGNILTDLIQDPLYQYPAMSGSLGLAASHTFDDARTSQFATLPNVGRADVDSDCAAEAAKVDTARYAFMSTQTADTIYCYEPGIYQSGTGAKNATITVGTGEVALLKPGAYYLKSGLDVSGRILGGYWADHPGVALMFDETGPGNCSGCVFNGNNALTIALNAGTRFPPTFAGGSPATAAIDWNNQPVQTSGPESPTPPLLMTLLVKKDPNCVVPTAPPFLEPSACNANKNKTLNMAGGGSLALEGVQYAPTDNVEIHGGSTGDGRVGQIISWTLFYSGGTHINQQGPSTVGNGIIRLDSACSGPAEPCNP